MLVEVSGGVRPGKPVLRVVLCGVALTATLGAAWFQVRDLRALGPVQQIPDTPLSVRVPKDWVPDPETPGAFVLPVQEEGWRRQMLRFERRVHFLYERRAEFTPVRTLAAELGIDEGVIDSARIAHFPAIEIRKSEVIRWRQSVIRRDTVVRIASLPRGDVIRIIYQPLDAIRPTDLDILDEICSSLYIDDPALHTAASELMEDAGVKIPADPSHLIAPPHLTHVPGLYVGVYRNGVPAGSIGVFRTWIAPDRTPRAMLSDIAAERWTLWGIDDRIEEKTLPGGRSIAMLTHPDGPRGGDSPQAAWIVHDSPDRAAVLFLDCDPTALADLVGVSAKLADELTLEPIDALKSFSAHLSAGAELAARLAERGPLPRWGREPVDVRYEGRYSTLEFTMRSRRNALQRDPQRGYEGSDTLRLDTGARPEAWGSTWTLDGKAGAYSLQIERLTRYGRVRIEERRRRPDGDVVRQVTVEGRPARRTTFEPGPRFIAPPAESIATGWVARGEVAGAIFDMSTSVGESVCSVFVRQLAPDGEFPRALVLRDFYPVGSIQTYDDDLAVVQAERAPALTYRRTPTPP